MNSSSSQTAHRPGSQPSHSRDPGLEARGLEVRGLEVRGLEARELEVRELEVRGMGDSEVRGESGRWQGWASAILKLAAVYNLLWGAWVVLFPDLFFQLLGIPPINYVPIWQCVGMIVGVYGIGYWIAASNPRRHWPIVLVGLLGKIFGPIGFVFALTNQQLPMQFGWMLISNDLVWWIPFAAILYFAFRDNTNTSAATETMTFSQALNTFRSQRNESLAHLSDGSPTLVVFLRHSGCTFCRQTLSELAAAREPLGRLPLSVVLVHMGAPMDGTLMLSKYDLDYWHHISDPKCSLYRAFGLGRGSFAELFSWSVIKAGVLAAIWKGHGVGKLQGDGFRMPGVFVIHKQRIIRSFMAANASQRLDFLAFAKTAVAEAANFQAADSQAAKFQAAGSQAAGSQAAGSQAAGSQAAGSQAAGSQCNVADLDRALESQSVR